MFCCCSEYPHKCRSWISFTNHAVKHHPKAKEQFSEVYLEQDDHKPELPENSDEESDDDLEQKLDKLFNAIQPLLNNLKQNPEKEYILWPNRLEKIEQFEDHIQKLYQGS